MFVLVVRSLALPLYYMHWERYLVLVHFVFERRPTTMCTFGCAKTCMLCVYVLPESGALSMVPWFLLYTYLVRLTG